MFKVTKVISAAALLMTTCINSNYAYAGDESAVTLEEIMVTATKRARSVQDVSVAVLAISGMELDNSHALSLQEIQYYAPSITIGAGLGVAFTYMRGLGLATNFGNVEPGVGFYIDGAVINTPAAQLTSLFDVERLEVLRGPQGTLFGRNTMGGAISVITRKPTRELEGYARLTVGKYQMMETEGAISGPLTSGLSARLAWRTTNRNGFGQNTYTGNDIDNVNRKNMRAHFQFDINEDMDFLLTADYMRQDDQSGAFLYAGPLFPDLPGLLDPTGIGEIEHLEGTRNIAGTFDPRNEREIWGVIGTFNWAINDDFKIKNIINYRDTDLFIQQDFDFAPTLNRADVTGKPATVNALLTRAQEFSEEFQVLYDGTLMDKPFEAIAGFYYFNEKRFTGTVVTTFAEGPRERIRDGVTLLEPRLNLTGDATTKSVAFFWHTMYEVVPNISLKLGGRFTHDERSVDNKNRLFVRSGAGAWVNRDFADSQSISEYNHEIGLDWRAQDNMLVYYTFSQGFKAGVGPSGTTDTDFVLPEHINNHEFGLKSDWFDNRLTVNLAAYYCKAKDIQFLLNIPQARGGFSSNFGNIADQKAHGIELEVAGVVTDNFRVRGSVSWTDATLSTFLSADNLDPQGQIDPLSVALTNFGGNRPRRTPEWAGTFHAEYDLPILEDKGAFTLSGDVSYKGEHFFEETNSARTMQGAYVIIDAGLRFVSADDTWNASLWVKNLTNELVLADRRPFFGSAAAMAQTYQPPMTWGATVGVSF
ncbi:MAG: TonB-dependent receptor [Emcibacter sp.]|nr:TonB-dependent receptor [Emcibacter sp.]